MDLSQEFLLVHPQSLIKMKNQWLEYQSTLLEVCLNCVPEWIGISLVVLTENGTLVHNCIRTWLDVRKLHIHDKVEG